MLSIVIPCLTGNICKLELLQSHKEVDIPIQSNQDKDAYPEDTRPLGVQSNKGRKQWNTNSITINGRQFGF